MDWNEILSGTVVSTQVAAARLIASLVAGAAIGLEREVRRQPAGLRTHILICLGATLLMLLSIWMPQTFAGSRYGDPARLAAQVVSGIGFLGAGAFIKIGNNMKGLTTAASIWVAAAMGLTIGAGLWLPATMTLILVLAVLVFLEPVERRFFPSERLKLLQIWYDGTEMDRAAVHALLRSRGIPVQSVDVYQSVREKRTRINLLVRIPVKADLETLFGEIRKTGKVLKIQLQEKY
ncbi:MAG TPA: MgtC/SapB family protein [Magnetospirillaceae bacterium]|nr:MgtC/SapB family protein [Magnetospirillaceae bacterium]